MEIMSLFECDTCIHHNKPMGSKTCLTCSAGGDSEYQPVHACSTCKHSEKKLTEEPCLICDIRLRNNKWEAKNE